MSANQPDNIDYRCAVCGEALKGADDSFINKVAGVLQENGVYAMALFLKVRGVTKSADGHSSKENEDAKAICQALLDLWTLPPLSVQIAAGDLFEQALRAAMDFSANIDLLLLARDLSERMLVYGRYHARARAK